MNEKIDMTREIMNAIEDSHVSSTERTSGYDESVIEWRISTAGEGIGMEITITASKHEATIPSGSIDIPPSEYEWTDGYELTGSSFYTPEGDDITQMVCFNRKAVITAMHRLYGLKDRPPVIL